MYYGADKNGLHLFKRITGLSGDIVKTRKDCRTSTLVRVPPNHIWVEGDAGEGESIDSNHFGPVPRRLVLRQLVFIFYPFHVAGRFRWWEFDVRDRIIRDQKLLQEYARGGYQFKFVPEPKMRQVLAKSARYFEETGDMLGCDILDRFRRLNDLSRRPSVVKPVRLGGPSRLKLWKSFIGVTVVSLAAAAETYAWRGSRP